MSDDRTPAGDPSVPRPSFHERVEATTPLSRAHIEGYRLVSALVERARTERSNLPTAEDEARELVARLEALGEDIDLEEAREVVATVSRLIDGPHYGRDFNGVAYGEKTTLRLALTVEVDVAEYLLIHEPVPDQRGLIDARPPALVRRHLLSELTVQAGDEARGLIAELGWATAVRHAQPRVELVWE